MYIFSTNNNVFLSKELHLCILQVIKLLQNIHVHIYTPIETELVQPESKPR